MNRYKVTFTCQNGHQQAITYEGVTKGTAEMWAGLCDGTSHFYAYPPGPDSVIGKCGICGGMLSSKVEESKDEVPK